MGIGATLMLAPALGPMLCLNDGDCTNEAQSIWNTNPLKRGVEIENLVGRSPDLVDNFPVIDRFDNGVATSIKSIDLFSKTYQNTGTLIKTVQGYVNSVANWQGTSQQGWGGVTITNQMIQARQLILAIPANASEEQLGALKLLQSWAQTQNVDLIITAVQ